MRNFAEMTPKVFAYISMGMAFFFTFMGVTVFFYPPPMLKEPAYMPYLISPALIAYAAFRFIRALRIINSKEEL